MLLFLITPGFVIGMKDTKERQLREFVESYGLQEYSLNANDTFESNDWIAGDCACTSLICNTKYLLAGSLKGCIAWNCKDYTVKYSSGDKIMPVGCIVQGQDEESFYCTLGASRRCHSMNIETGKLEMLEPRGCCMLAYNTLQHKLAVVKDNRIIVIDPHLASESNSQQEWPMPDFFSDPTIHWDESDGLIYTARGNTMYIWDPNTDSKKYIPFLFQNDISWFTRDQNKNFLLINKYDGSFSTTKCAMTKYDSNFENPKELLLLENLDEPSIHSSNFDFLWSYKTLSSYNMLPQISCVTFPAEVKCKGLIISSDNKDIKKDVEIKKNISASACDSARGIFYLASTKGTIDILRPKNSFLLHTNPQAFLIYSNFLMFKKGSADSSSCEG